MTQRANFLPVIAALAILRTSALQQHLSGRDHLNSSNNVPAPLLTDIFLFGGQSNCVGFGQVSDMMPTIPKNMLAFPMSYSGKPPITKGWTNYKVRESMDDPYFGNYVVGRYGSEISFGQELATNIYQNENFGVVKSSKSGTSLEKNWLQGDPNDLLDELLVRAKAAREAPECTGGFCSIKALIWVQGEADAGTADYADHYKMNLETLVTRIRTELGLPSLFVMIVELPTTGAVSEKVGADRVRQAQNDFVKEQGSKLAAIVSTANVTTYAKGSEYGPLHYTTEGLVLLGKRLAGVYNYYARSL